MKSNIDQHQIWNAVAKEEKKLRTMTQVNACISKANTSQSSGEKHLTLCLEVIGILHSTRKIFDGTTECMEREHIRDGIGTLVSRSHDGVRGARSTLIIGNGGP